ncbi:MAG TPA: hypothetical protein VM869_32680, partial [Enhygromyxa sp.]|nr:hypothetical protein [Enhygromyxa sp.]
MKFVFDSAALCEGLVAPVARCFAAALDELGLEPVIAAEPELARAMPVERPPIGESGRERELEARDHAASSSGSKVASVAGRAESVGPRRTARRESGEVARLRLRPREPGRSQVEPRGASSLASEAASLALEQQDSSLERDSRGATADARAPRAVELDSTPSERAGFDAARVAELLAKRIEGTPATAGRVSVQPRVGADASSSSASASPIEEPIEVEPASRELASSDSRA